ncbi:MAG: heparinase II/III family protein [Defluviitaleaceae bacterium]|nr:heparinase II/III family protein [Defluviitaleaceae bacterium]
MNNEFNTKFHPEQDNICENPPRFTWPLVEPGTGFTLTLAKDPAFANIIDTVENIPYNFYTPTAPLPPGEYYWKVDTDNAPRKFEVGQNLPETPLPSRATRYKDTTASHPRLWLNTDELRNFREMLRQDPSHCRFDTFYTHSVEPRIAEGFPQEPKPYPNDVRVVDLWRKSYMTCQQALCYIRSLSIAGVVLEDENILAKAKSALLEIAGWAPDGPTSRKYNDECAFRVGPALAFGYDWLQHLLSPEEQDKVMGALYRRTKEVADYVIDYRKIHNFPYDSHAVRSLSMMLTPCCIAMLDFSANDTRHRDAVRWLDYTVEYLSALYTPWGGIDGGWAEGPAYWTTGMAFVTEALNFIKGYMGIDLYKRPFFSKTGDYILHCNPPHTYFASFCDQSNLGQKPDAKRAFNMRQFAGTTGNPKYQWYFNRVMEREAMESDEFSIKGWWDFYYDDMVFLSRYGIIEEEAPANDTTVAHFRDIGWVAVNKNAADFENHVMLVVKSSPYGAVSHSHGDQNSFVLFAFGQPLIINSGYYVAYGSKMHLNWRKQTKSANTILIDGIGQHAGRTWEESRDHGTGHRIDETDDQKMKQLLAKGKIVDVKQTGESICIVADATQAYAQNIPYLKSYTREVVWHDDNRLVITDKVALTQEGQVTSLLHGLQPFKIEGSSFNMKIGDVLLSGEVSANSGLTGITQSNVFDGVDADEIKGLPCQYHLSINTRPAKTHEIRMELTIGKCKD